MNGCIITKGTVSKIVVLLTNNLTSFRKTSNEIYPFTVT